MELRFSIKRKIYFSSSFSEIWLKEKKKILPSRTLILIVIKHIFVFLRCHSEGWIRLQYLISWFMYTLIKFESLVNTWMVLAVCYRCSIPLYLFLFYIVIFSWDNYMSGPHFTYKFENSSSDTRIREMYYVSLTFWFASCLLGR